MVTGGSVSGTSLTLERSVGADVVITGLPSGGGGTGNTDPVVYLARQPQRIRPMGFKSLPLLPRWKTATCWRSTWIVGTGDTLAGRVLIPSTLVASLASTSNRPRLQMTLTMAIHRHWTTRHLDQFFKPRSQQLHRLV